MANEDVQAIKGEDKEAEAEKTAERLAEADSPTAEEKKSPEVKAPETAEKPEKTPEEQATEAESVPEDPKKRGQAFAEMRNRIKELEQEKEEQVAEPTGFEDTYQVPPVGQDYNQFVNPQTGEVDFAKYDQSKTREVRTEVQRGIDDYRQEQEAYQAYPELDPKHNEHNKELFEAVRGRLTDSMLHPGRGGKVITMKEAADAVLNLGAKARKEVESQAADKALEDVATKEAISSDAGGNSGRAASAESVGDIEALSDQTRKGGRKGAEAIADRLDKMGT